MLNIFFGTETCQRPIEETSSDVATMASRMVSSQTADFSTEWILKTKLKSKEVQEMLLY